MKIKVEGDKIIKGVKKVDGIEIVLENPGEAYRDLKDIKVTAFERYETSAVDYKMIFLLEFLFEDDVPLDTKVSAIRELQTFLDKI